MAAEFERQVAEHSWPCRGCAAKNPEGIDKSCTDSGGMNQATGLCGAETMKLGAQSWLVFPEMTEINRWMNQ